MTTTERRLLDWLDDLCVRFIVNAPYEELQSVERICFQIEEAQWFYEDFIRPLDPSLPSMNLRSFSQRIFQHCPLFAGYSQDLYTGAYETFMQYKTRVPVRGAIMLNEDMTHAVLVKGWKKGAKWSFPRGKINKDEDDLDCAVREVYEETGYDLRAAGLVRPESEMKRIAVNMHQQQIMLFVFRGVPMDTFFEPRTRKEISKVDWYKLSDLPTLKRKNQQQQGNGQDLIKENSFYMVGPFMGPLKGWIKMQKRLDKQRAAAGPHPVAPIATGVTDTELEADLGETTADEAFIPEHRPDGNFAELVAQLGRSHRSSDALPEVSSQMETEKMMDPAAELKRLLSVGGSGTSQARPFETLAPSLAQEPPANPLLAMLQGNRPGPHPESLPRTPFEQILPAPQQPQSPHGQHHPRQPHLSHMGPPPPFPFHPPQGLPFHGHQHPHLSSQQQGGPPMPIPQSFVPPSPHHMNPPFTTHLSGPPQSYGQQPRQPPPYPQSPQQFSGPHGPPASRLPPPKLTAHTLGLLNAFKMNEKPAISSPQAPQPEPTIQATPKMQQPLALHKSLDTFTSPPGVQSAHPYAPSPPAFHSPPPNANFQPVQPKPRNAHQDSLLSLFRSPSMLAATPPPQRTLEQPAELSAQPSTPGHIQTNLLPDQRAAQILDSFNFPDADENRRLREPTDVPFKHLEQPKTDLTSATVRGPVNAPDFDTVKKHAQHAMNGHSRGPSPALIKPEQKMFVPPQILQRRGTPSTVQSPTIEPSASVTSSPRTVIASTAFKPQILKRPQQMPTQAPAPGPTAHTQGLLNLFKSGTSPQPEPVVAPVPAPPAHFSAPAPAASAPFDRRDAQPQDHKNALLSLFSKPSSQRSGSPIQPSKSPLAPPSAPKSPLPTSPIPPSRSPQPPTPKTLMSGVISPVSPLPDKGSQMGSPAHPASRSRISSLGESMPPGLVIAQGMAPTSHPGAVILQKNGFAASGEEGYMSSGSASINELGGGVDKGKATGESSGKSPVDKNFLLGFLNDVARKGR